MNSLIYGILIGCLISFSGAVLFASSLDYPSLLVTFIGGLLLVVGGSIITTHIIAIGVKLGNDLSKK